jgi:ABC-type polysaccharide/polyol phosphate transport system ATPase subunit
MSEIVIRVEGLGKRYRVGERERYLALRDVLTRLLASPLRLRNRRPVDFLWALRNINFDISRGEVVGLIGRNGAGKSTLLKILARITRPTEGWADLTGRVGSLLEVGTGFHPELTGRENVYLSGAILGMRKKEIARKFDEIVSFAEVERFLDTPLKHYSSGMQMRLAFAVAAHLEPEILLVDEVLAVGDLQFQKKCLGKMGDVAKTGRTIVFVSHQMNQIRRLCKRVFWIDGGRIRETGPTAPVLGAYESVMASGDQADQHEGSGSGLKGRFVCWEIAEPREDQPNVLSALGPVTVRFVVQVYQPVLAGHHGIALRNIDNQLIWAWAANDIALGVGEHEFCYTFPMLPVRPGPYIWQVSLYSEGNLIDVWNCLPNMIVATEVHQHARDEWNGILNVPCKFSVLERNKIGKTICL